MNADISTEVSNFYEKRSNGKEIFSIINITTHFQYFNCILYVHVRGKVYKFVCITSNILFIYSHIKNYHFAKCRVAESTSYDRRLIVPP